eukprot:191412_1
MMMVSESKRRIEKMLFFAVAFAIILQVTNGHHDNEGPYRKPFFRTCEIESASACPSADSVCIDDPRDLCDPERFQKNCVGFCVGGLMDGKPCTSDYYPLCTTDGRTFDGECAFNRYFRYHRDDRIKHFGRCHIEKSHRIGLGSIAQSPKRQRLNAFRP